MDATSHPPVSISTWPGSKQNGSCRYEHFLFAFDVYHADMSYYICYRNTHTYLLNPHKAVVGEVTGMKTTELAKWPVGA